MLRRNRVEDDRSSRIEHAPRARGGISPGGILTGVVVAFGAIFLLSALIGGVLVSTGVTDEALDGGGVVDAGVGGGIAFIVAQFLAYMWGGYTAGRMARGAGVLNGLLVPFIAILIALTIGAIAAGLGATGEMNLPFQDARLPIEQDVAVDWGIGLGIAALVLMFVGGALGGLLGTRWHTKLERRAEEEVEGRHLREAPAEPARRERPAETTTTSERTTDRRAEPGDRRAEPDDATTRQPRR